MFLFWITAALLGAGAASLIVWRAAWASKSATEADPAIEVYRRALTEIDDLADRGMIVADERRTARAETGRRLLAEAERPASPVDARLGPFPLLAAATTPVLAAVAIYLAVGSPGLTDQPFADRLRAWRANPERYDAPELAAALRSLAQSRPDDPEPWRRLAGLDLSLGDADGAAHALRRALAIAPGRSDLMAPLGEIMVLKARGSVDPDARAIFMQVLRRDPTSPTARYYLARAAIASGDTVGGLATWRGLLADLAPDDPRRGLLAKEVATVERTGALPPPAAAGAAPPPGIPDAIRGMVDGLAARLRAHPDDPDGWVRLVRAYAVLGETGRRDAALAFARGRYADRPALLGQLTAAAAAPRMGSAPP